MADSDKIEPVEEVQTEEKAEEKSVNKTKHKKKDSKVKCGVICTSLKTAEFGKRSGQVMVTQLKAAVKGTADVGRKGVSSSKQLGSKVGQKITPTNSKPSLDAKSSPELTTIEEFETQVAWEALSKWLQQHPLRSLELPAELDVTGHGGCPDAPVFGMENKSKIVKVTIKKRFSSRKVPHLIAFENEDGKAVSYIYKQDDDITMDVVIMKLFHLCNSVWERKGIHSKMYTYEIVSCSDKTGFGQVVPGDTMFNFHAKEMDEALGEDEKNWFGFVQSLIGVIVTTAIFDITDRHHSNVMFTKDGKIALIDLSASLGAKAPLDAGLAINPVYLPNRLLAMHDAFVCLQHNKWDNVDFDSDFADMEEMAISAYYAIYNDRNIRQLLGEIDYKMLQPWKFLRYLHERPKQNQYKEGLRNDIVRKMDESKTFGSFVAAFTAIVPMN